MKKNRKILLFCHHKTGTIFLKKVFKEFSRQLDLSFTSIFGYVDQARFNAGPADHDVILMGQSLLDESILNQPFRGAHFIRDPRDVVVSGYFYHLRCDESWCVQPVASLIHTSRVTGPLLLHAPPRWKLEATLKNYKGSYQEALRGLSQEDGLAFEIRHSARWTTEGMLQWKKHHDIEEMRFEDLTSSSESLEEAMEKLALHFGLTSNESDVLQWAAEQHDINKMNEEDLRKNTHITSRQTARWKKYFNDKITSIYLKEIGLAHEKLGYEPF